MSTETKTANNEKTPAGLQPAEVMNRTTNHQESETIVMTLPGPFSPNHPHNAGPSTREVRKMWNHQYAGLVRGLVKSKGGDVGFVADTLQISEQGAWSLWLGKTQWNVTQLFLLAHATDIELVRFFRDSEEDNTAPEVPC